MDRVLCWSARGAGSLGFRAAVKDLVKLNKVDLLIICEPRIQFVRAASFFCKLGFDGTLVSEVVGFSGGNWVLWNKNNLKVEKIDVHFQVVSMRISEVGKPPWMLAAIYASHINSSRDLLWSHLDNIVGSYDQPWLFVGDYNEVLNAKDKWGGSGRCNFGGMKEWVSRNGLVDMGYCGADFTWANAAVNASVRVRLDRGLCTASWRILFAEAVVFHMAKTNSDHCPLLIKLLANPGNVFANYPFRFHVMWLRHDNFGEVLNSYWSNYDGSLMSNLEGLANLLTKWNRDVFGNIFKKKRHLLASLRGIQVALSRHANPYLENLEKELINEYNLIRDSEEMYWKQKSRDKWLQEGDRNTRFFHLTTIIRRRRNKVVGLMNAEGRFCTEPKEIMQIDAGYFMEMFSKQPDGNCDYNEPSMFPRVDGGMLVKLGCPVKIDKVHRALFQIGRLKAPGHDGFPYAFFQDNWRVCGGDIMKLVTRAFEERKIGDGT